MTKAIIFDCWHTLFFNKQNPHPFEKFANKIGYDLKDYKFAKVFETHFMLKKYNNLRVPIINLLIDLKIKATPKLVTELEKLYKKSYTNHCCFPESLKILRKLKKNYKLGLLTNTDCHNFIRIHKKYKLDSYFDVILASYDIGLIKPDPKIFELMLVKLGVTKKDAIMVGDSMKDDIEGAKKVGINGILIDRKGKYPHYKHRITSLAQLESFL